MIYIKYFRVFEHGSSLIPYPEHPQNLPNLPSLNRIGRPHLSQIGNEF